MIVKFISQDLQRAAFRDEVTSSSRTKSSFVSCSWGLCPFILVGLKDEENGHKYTDICVTHFVVDNKDPSLGLRSLKSASSHIIVIG